MPGTLFTERHLRELISIMYIEKVYQDAADFMNALCPRSSEWATAPREWIFRGQNVNEDLRARSFREDSWTQMPKDLIDPPFELRDPYLQNYREYKTLIKFVELADDYGVVLPMDSEAFRNDITIFKNAINSQNLDSIKNVASSVPPDGSMNSPWYAIMALAQHYGLPTRLLDWTKHPFIAAFHAASGKKTAGEDIVVWACRTKNLETDISGQIRIIKPPGSWNPNLVAQEGVFIYASNLTNDQQKLGLNKIEKIKDSFQKYSLRSVEIPGLLRQLNRERMHYARLFPGLDGVVKAIYDRKRWEDASQD